MMYVSLITRIMQNGYTGQYIWKYPPVGRDKTNMVAGRMAFISFRNFVMQPRGPQVSMSRHLSGSFKWYFKMVFLKQLRKTHSGTESSALRKEGNGWGFWIAFKCSCSQGQDVPAPGTSGEVVESQASKKQELWSGVTFLRLPWFPVLLRALLTSGLLTEANRSQWEHLNEKPLTAVESLASSSLWTLPRRSLFLFTTVSDGLNKGFILHQTLPNVTHVNGVSQGTDAK